MSICGPVLTWSFRGSISFPRVSRSTLRVVYAMNRGVTSAGTAVVAGCSANILRSKTTGKWLRCLTWASWNSGSRTSASWPLTTGVAITWGVPGTGIATGGSPTGFVLARGGKARPAAPADRVGGDQDIMCLPECAPLRIAAGGVPSITVRETFERAAKSVARTEATAALAMTSAVIVATVTIAVIATMTVVARAVLMAVKIVSLRSAVIAAMTAVESAVVIAVKIVSVASAVIVAKPAVKIVLARSRAAWAGIADTTVATAPMPAGKRAAIVGNVERVAANEAMMGATAATIGVEVARRRPISAANARTLP